MQKIEIRKQILLKNDAAISFNVANGLLGDATAVASTNGTIEYDQSGKIVRSSLSSESVTTAVRMA